jgi:hypothetical protein
VLVEEWESSAGRGVGGSCDGIDAHERKLGRRSGADQSPQEGRASPGGGSGAGQTTCSASRRNS